MKRVIIIIGITLLPLLMWAQVTGNVQMRDIYKQLETDHSGVKVTFIPTNGTAVLDSTVTDVNGDFSKTLVNGLYEIEFDKPGYCPELVRNVTTPIYIAPNVEMNETLPIVYIPGGHVSGVWSGPANYWVQDTIRVPVGDTLRITEGAVINGVFDSLSANNALFDVDGVLIIEGSDSLPVRLTRDASGRCVALNHSIFDMNIKPSGKLFATNFEAFASVINFEPGSNSEIISGNFDLSSQLNIDAAQLVMSNSRFEGVLNFIFGSEGIFNCNFLNGPIDLAPSTSAVFTDNELGDRMRLEADQAASIIFNNNLIHDDAYMLVRNSNLGFNTQLSLLNNSFQTQGLIISGKVDLVMRNNVMGDLEVQDSLINPVDISHNLFLWRALNASGSSAIFEVPGLIYFPNVQVDTFDQFNNRYIDDFEFVNDNFYQFNNFPALTDTLTDSLLIDKGDPTILDADGSPSDLGAVANSRCDNPSFPHYGPTPNPNPTYVDSVFPGDCNYNGVANNFDLLPLGIYYNQTGSSRVGASLVWEGQVATNWGTTQTSGFDIKHVDANGDGTINIDDINAINLNYGFTHTNFKASFGDGLWLAFPDSVYQGDTVDIGIMLGFPNQPINDVYSLAFAINYDSSLIVPGSGSARFNNSWLGIDTVDMISINQDGGLNVQRIDIAMTRIDGANKDGEGQVGTVTVVMNDDILGKDILVPVPLSFTNIYASDNQGNQLLIGAEDGYFTAIAAERPVSNGLELKELPVEIYPNPAKDQLRMYWGGEKNIQLQITDLTGKVIYQAQNINEAQTTLNVSGWQKGIYIVNARNAQGSLTQKISIVK